MILSTDPRSHFYGPRSHPRTILRRGSTQPLSWSAQPRHPSNHIHPAPITMPTSLEAVHLRPSHNSTQPRAPTLAMPTSLEAVHLRPSHDSTQPHAPTLAMPTSLEAVHLRPSHNSTQPHAPTLAMPTSLEAVHLRHVVHCSRRLCVVRPQRRQADHQRAAKGVQGPVMVAL